MGVKVATTSLHCSQPILHPHHQTRTSSSTTTTTTTSSTSKSRARRVPIVCRYVVHNGLDPSALFGAGIASPSNKLSRTLSCDFPISRRRIQPMKRACSASLDASFSDEEFSKKIQELALKFQLTDDDVDVDVDVEEDRIDDDSIKEELEMLSGFIDTSNDDLLKFDNNVKNKKKKKKNQGMFSAVDAVEPPWVGGIRRQELPEWKRGDETTPAGIEWKANSVDLPLSLRIIKRKKQWQEGFKEVGESAYCSVKKAFSSMVFMIRELQSYTLQMRELLSYEELQGILVRVQTEMNASFVWLFQQVFSHTPTLMVYVMILLANFTVYSMGSNAAIAAAIPPPSSIMESVSVIDEQTHQPSKSDSSIVKSFLASFSGGKTTSVGGNSGGGDKTGPVASGTDGDGGLERFNNHPAILPDGTSQLSSIGKDRESVSGQEVRKEETSLWNSIVEEASSSFTDKSLDHETMQRFVSPLNVKVEDDDYADYFRTELVYQTGLAREPKNTLLLANYAQFLYLVAHDYDRAEEYFQKAVKVSPVDAEACNKYATFLWTIRNDLWAAEETFLEAISAEPGNTYYAANYAHFLWNTGGEDTCFPLTDTTHET